jgi:hypothetical protein
MHLSKEELETAYATSIDMVDAMLSAPRARPTDREDDALNVMIGICEIIRKENGQASLDTLLKGLCGEYLSRRARTELHP